VKELVSIDLQLKCDNKLSLIPMHPNYAKACHSNGIPWVRIGVLEFLWKEKRGSHYIVVVKAKSIVIFKESYFFKKS
jgi:hypothetical protein